MERPRAVYTFQDNVYRKNAHLCFSSSYIPLANFTTYEGLRFSLTAVVIFNWRLISLRRRYKLHFYEH